MKEGTLFDIREVNPNAHIFTIPPQYGTDDSDNYFASIGDATQKHVSSLNDKDRQAWEGLISIRNGSIFRTEPSDNAFDPDPNNLHGVDLEDYIKQEVSKLLAPPKEDKKKKKKTISEYQIVAIQEAVEEELAFREKSEDIYDRSERLSLDDLKTHPGMLSHVDLPSTPRDRLCFMGDCSQAFYDYFPSEHPASKYLNQLLISLNNTEARLLNETCKWLKQQVDNWPAETTCIKHTAYCILDAATGLNAQEQIENALKELDKQYGKTYWQVSVTNTLQDELVNLLILKSKEWTEKRKKNIDVTSDIKMFGVEFFKLKTSMRISGASERIKDKYHWTIYKRLKLKFNKPVMLSGLDVNKAGFNQLKKTFADLAEDIFFGRPYESLADLYNKGFVNSSTLASNQQTERVLVQLEEALAKSKEMQKLVPLEILKNHLMRAQTEKQLQVDWSTIWSYYKLLKSEFRV